MQGELDQWIQSLKQCQLLKEKDVKTLCARVREIFVEEANVQRIDSPVKVVGDIHGQFWDLMEVFKQGGDCPNINYLFLGDYVNRGFNSIETICLLFALKLRYSERMTLLRGNHECRILTQSYGLYDESMKKYSSLNVWRYLTETFDYMPLSAVIEDKIWCVHGGIAQDTKALDEIRALDRVAEIPLQGEVCELLWNDPAEDETKGFRDSNRGYGRVFGEDIFKYFLHLNGLNEVIRAHSVVMEGQRVQWSSCRTVFSAPNYCQRCGNVGAFYEISEGLQITAKTFEASEVQVSKLQYQM